MDENPYQASGGDGSRPRPPGDWRRAAWCVMVVAATAALSVIAVFVSAAAHGGMISQAALLVGGALAVVAGLMFGLQSSQP